MNGKYIPQTLNPHAFDYSLIDKANFPLYGEGIITKLDNAYFRSLVGQLVIISAAFTLGSALSASTPFMGFNSYTGIPNSNVYGALINEDGMSTGIYIGYVDNVPQIYCSAPMGTGTWRGFIMFTVDA